jgi:hypothetical protein
VQLDPGVISALVSVITVIGLLFATFASLLQARRRIHTRGETTEQRVNRLTSALTEATRTIEEIEREMRERQSTVDRLRRDAETYERLKEVNREEVEAVAEVLDVRLQKEGRRSFWVNVAMNFGFFVLGAVVSIITTPLIG